MAFNETVRKGWDRPRPAISADDTLVTAAVDTMKFANIPSYAFRVSSMHNAIEIGFSMDADGKACAGTVFAARKNGDIVQVWTGTLTAGKQVSGIGTDVYVDTFGSTTDSWITTIKEVDAGGADRMARIVLDTCGYDYWFTQFTGLSSETAQAHYSGF
jgi:hypothetical protein